MNDDQTEQPEEQAGAQNNAPATPGLVSITSPRTSKAKLWLLFGVSAVVFLFAGMIAAGVGLSIFQPLLREIGPRGNAYASGSVICNDWSGTPSGWQAIIQASAGKVKENGVSVQPALVGALLLSENGNSWSGVNEHILNKDWPTGGPFQFKNWTNIWKSVTEQGFSNKATGNINDPADSSLAAATYVKNSFDQEKIPINATDEKYILYIGLAYNRTPDIAHQWATQNNYDLNSPIPNSNNSAWVWGATDANGVGYAFRLWNHFQQLNQGCQSIIANTQQAGEAIAAKAREQLNKDTYLKPSSGTDCSIYNPDNNPCDKWCAYFVEWVYKEAGFQLDITSGEAADLLNSKNINKYLISNGRLSNINQLKPGDILVEQKDGQNHAGIIDHVDIANDLVYTIEGNSSNDKVTNPSYKASAAIKGKTVDGWTWIGIGRLK